jgi:1,2-diacylglycerol 3-alpha-glucosyltransferase
VNILLVSESYWPNADGGALFERRLVLGMVDRGHHVEVWAPGTKATAYTEKDGPYVIRREKSWRFIFNWKYRVSYWPVWSARTVIRRAKPEVIHIHNFWGMGVFALFWAQIYRIPVLGTNHFMPENALLNVKFLQPLSGILNPLIWAYLVFLHNRCNFVTSPTETAVNLLIEHGLTVPSEAITNGIDTKIFHAGYKTEKLREKYKLPLHARFILYLGRVDGEKRIDLIISALPKIDHKIHLVIAGFGIAMDELKRQASVLSVSDRVTFTGFIDDEDKPAFYNLAEIFVMSSPAELQGIVLLEAMSSELPLVGVDVAAISELCRDGVNGLLFPQDDSAALAERVNRLTNDDHLRHEFGQASRRIVVESHSTTYTFDRYETAYQGINLSKSSKVAS